MRRYKITDKIMPHLEKLRLGAKFIPLGEHRNMNFHDHDFSELSIVLQAENTYHWVDGKSCPISRGDVILIHPGKSHGYENIEKFSIFNLLYDPANLPIPLLDGSNMLLFNYAINPKIWSDIPPEKPILHFTEEELVEVEHVAKQLSEELDSLFPGKYLRAFALFLNLLTFICRASGSLQNKDVSTDITSAINYLNNNFSQKIDMDVLARQTNMSRSSFFRRFKELTGFTPLQYLTRKRVMQVEYLLRTTNFKLSHIATLCGFYDSNHLSSVFNKYNSLSPRAYRKKNK
jgi:AraC family L-rhamnose operon transcriptional activator RhaR/AraC family L-rhamnose operon regulatory protein RhaS